MKITLNPQSAKARRLRLAAAVSLANFMPSNQTGLAAKEDSDASSFPVWKRGLDLACILFLLPATLLLMASVAAMIKAVSPGPVFFKQERVGHRGRRFICWKFRSMKTDADPAAHRQHVQELLRSDAPMTKLDAKGDPRLIPFGAMLRATGLDELPQLINVLRGEMSIVGPRPSLPYEVESFLPWQQARFDTPPGLTGLWQVSGKNRTTFTEMLTLDVHYARHKSLRMDVMILARTFAVLVSQARAARRP